MPTGGSWIQCNSCFLLGRVHKPPDHMQKEHHTVSAGGKGMGPKSDDFRVTQVM